MRILVQPHDFALGGSQLNAVELAAAVRDRGHDVYLACRPGPITDLAASLGLELLDLPTIGRRPSPAIARALRRWASELGLDVLHGYEWPPGLETWTASLGGSAAPVTTVYSMDVAPFLPGGLDLVVGTAQIGARVTPHREGEIHVIEPPVDTRSNAPGTGGAELRRSLGIPDGELVISVVGRLVPELKLEGVLGAVASMALLPEDGPRATLLVVGDGSARDVVEGAADEVNAALGRAAVRVVGEMRDPRPAYDVADIALGMGGSALRALAFGTPLVVQGERGFWRTLTPESYRDFAWAGWYGVSDGEDSSRALTRELGPLLADASLRQRLGGYGQDLVRRHYSLDAAATKMESVYGVAVDRSRRRMRHAPRAAAGVFAYKARRTFARRFGVVAADDFNDVAGLASQRPPESWVAPGWAEAGEPYVT